MRRLEQRLFHSPQPRATTTPDARVGDIVVAQDGPLGRIERVVRSESRAPVYLVVVVGSRTRRRYPVIPCALVTAVDRSRQRVDVRGRRKSLGRRSETLPLVL